MGCEIMKVFMIMLLTDDFFINFRGVFLTVKGKNLVITIQPLIKLS